MARIERSALFAQPAGLMFDLINDVAAYPDYMAGCERAEILSHSATEMIARLHLRKAGLHYSFTTRNELRPPSAITLQLVDGPFSRFAGAWQLTDLSPSACKVEFTLEFQVVGRLATRAIELLLAAVADDMVAALSARSQAL